MTSRDKTLLAEIQDYGCIVDTREIFLHSHYASDEDPGIDYRMAVTLQKNLRYLESLNKDGIVIHLISAGGSISDGFAIFDMISACESHITIVGHGIVASMATLIFQAGDLRLLMPNCDFMIHYGEVDTTNQMHTFVSYAKWVEAWMNKLLDIFVARCSSAAYFKNNSENDIRQFLDRKIKEQGDVYITPRDCVLYGLADAIIGGAKYPNLSRLCV